MRDAMVFWQVTGLLGRGTQGNVWSAVRSSDGRQVVVKCLHRLHHSDIHSADSAKQYTAKIFWDACHREIGILEECSGHPNIVQIIGKSPDYSQIFLEKAASDLYTIIRDLKKLDLKQELECGAHHFHSFFTFGKCRRWSKDILCGVAHLHAVGVSIASRVLHVREE